MVCYTRYNGLVAHVTENATMELPERELYVVGCCRGERLGMAASERGWVTVSSGKYLVFASEKLALQWAIRKLGTRGDWFVLACPASLIPVGPVVRWNLGALFARPR